MNSGLSQWYSYKSGCDGRGQNLYFHFTFSSDNSLSTRTSKDKFNKQEKKKFVIREDKEDSGDETEKNDKGNGNKQIIS